MGNKEKLYRFLILLMIPLNCLKAQEVNQLLNKIKDKLNTVKDYQAEGIMKLNVPFLQVPDSRVVIYFRQPDKFLIKQQKGISLVPKAGIVLNLTSLLRNDKYTAVDAGSSLLNNVPARIIKLLPLDENGEVVLSTLYVDDSRLLIRKATSTTKENGSYEVSFSYGRYSNWGLPDEVVFSFNTKDYKLPKGMTFDYEEEKTDTAKLKNAKGEVKIVYTSYIINKGISPALFEKSEGRLQRKKQTP